MIKKNTVRKISQRHKRIKLVRFFVFFFSHLFLLLSFSCYFFVLEGKSVKRLKRREIKGEKDLRVEQNEGGKETER